VRDHAAYRTFVRRGFAAGRPVVPRLVCKRLGRDLGFGPDARASDLDAVQWTALYRGNLSLGAGRTLES
jgi:hypothetical protein